jgi:hypothetical protein
VRLAGCIVMVGADPVAAFCAMVPHPATSKNKVKNELAKVFFTSCIAFPFRSRTGHPFWSRPVWLLDTERGASDADGEYVLLGRDTTGPGNRMGSVGTDAEIEKLHVLTGRRVNPGQAQRLVLRIRIFRENVSHPEVSITFRFCPHG